jgi:hypothetical protein
MTLRRSTLLLVAGVAGIVGCADPQASVPAPTSYSSAAHAERDLAQLAAANIEANPLLAVIAKYDSGLRPELLAALRQAYGRGGMSAARTDAAGYAGNAFNRYVKKYAPRSSDAAATRLGRAFHAMLAKLNADSEVTCGAMDPVVIGRRNDLLRIFQEVVAATENVIVSAQASPQPLPDTALYGPEFVLINRRVTERSGAIPAGDNRLFNAIPPDERIKQCRVAEFTFKEILDYQAESAGPMLRIVFSHLPG